MLWHSGLSTKKRYSTYSLTRIWVNLRVKLWSIILLGSEYSLIPPVHTPERNMVIERVWQSIGESTIAMLLRADLSEPYWEEARKTACYLYNWSPGGHSKSNPVSTYEHYYGIRPHLSQLWVFGSRCYPFRLVVSKCNHEVKACEGVFVGYQEQLVGWKFTFPKQLVSLLRTTHASW